MSKKKISVDIEEFTKEEPVKEDNSLLKWDKKDLLSCGSTILNLHVSGTTDGCFLKGTYSLIIGDSNTGKSFVAHTILAEATLNPKFDNYKLIIDDTENGNFFPVSQLFGNKTASRIEKAHLERTNKAGMLIECSQTVEDFFKNIRQKCKEAIDKNAPFVYVLDSLDSLTSCAEIDKTFEDDKKLDAEKGIGASYGDGKAKAVSTGLRSIIQLLNQSKSILIIICQEKIALGSMIPNQKRFSGGASLKFYATTLLWLKNKGNVTATIKGVVRELGIETEIQIKKNRLRGLCGRNNIINIFPKSGIDDIGSMIDYLIFEQVFKKSGAKINTEKFFQQELTKEKLVNYIEENNLEKELKELCLSTYETVQELIESSTKRKRKYE